MSDRERPSRPTKSCPICGRPAEPAEAPFCSARCRRIDLGNWLGGRYAIPTAERPDDGEARGRDAAAPPGEPDPPSS